MISRFTSSFAARAGCATVCVAIGVSFSGTHMVNARECLAGNTRNEFEKGHAYFMKEWSRPEGFLSAAGQDGGIYGSTNSCFMCHNFPFGNPGAGANAIDTSGFGRNTVHLFGVGIVESISQYIEHSIYEQLDKNGDGVIGESEQHGDIFVESTPENRLYFGTFEDRNSDAIPDLDQSLILNLMPGGAQGRSFEFMHSPYGWSRSDHQFPTIRTFILGVFQSVFGMHVRDDVTAGNIASSGSMKAKRSPTSVEQMVVQQPDAAAALRYGEVIDALEIYLINQPLPHFSGSPALRERGRKLMGEFQCNACHTQDWEIPASLNLRRADFTGFESQDDTAHLELIDSGKRLSIKDIQSDFRHHDMGPKFAEYAYTPTGISVRTIFRTPALWGLGSSAPYGHDGQSLTIQDAILRHGGEAETARGLFLAASLADREHLISFLEAMQLYDARIPILDKCGINLFAVDDRAGAGSAPAAQTNY